LGARLVCLPPVGAGPSSLGKEFPPKVVGRFYHFFGVSGVVGTCTYVKSKVLVNAAARHCLGVYLCGCDTVVYYRTPPNRHPNRK